MGGKGMNPRTSVRQAEGGCRTAGARMWLSKRKRKRLHTRRKKLNPE